jgi:hypothetical protein
MSSTYSPDLRIELIGTGDQAGVWGATTNNNLTYVLEQAIAGYVSVSVISANQALTYLNGASAVAADNQSVHANLALTTTTGANFAVYAPPSSKQYTIYNASAYTATIYNSTVIGNTTAAGTGVAIPTGKTMTVWSDGTNFTQQNTHLISPTVAGGTLTSPTLVTPALGTPTSGTLTNATGLPISTGVSGLGTGVATFLATPSSANLAAAVTNETGSGSLVFATSPTLVTPALGTPASGVLTSCTGLPMTTGVTGTLPVANGGTGVTASTGTTSVVLSNGPTLVAPNLGTPASGTLTNTTGLPISTGVSGLGTGVAAALAVNVGTAGAPLVNGGVLGTPSSGTLTNATGLPISTGVSGLGTGVATFLATPSSANLAAAVTNETGSGALVFATSPTLVTPALGTPTSGTLTNATGLPISTGVSGLGTGVATALAVNVGTAGAPVVNGGVLGTPSSGTLTNCTFPTLNQNTTGTAAGLSATLAVASGGTGTTTAQGAMNAFAGAVTSGSYLRGNGTNVVMSAIQVADVPTLNQNTTGSSGSCTGNSATATSATSATSAVNLVTTNFTIQESGGKLVFKYGATTIASMDSAGVFTSISDITAGGTP